MRRIAVLWTELSGYLNSCLRALVDRHPIELMVYRVAQEEQTHRPYDEMLFAWLPRLHTIAGNSRRTTTAVYDQLRSFEPDAVLVSGWSVPVYRAVTQRLKRKGVYVISGLDNPWRGTLKQWAGVMLSRWYLHSRFDAVWVPGERAAVFARKLGFTGRKLMFGLYSADTPALKKVASWRMESEPNKGWPNRFLFVGRYVEIKGLRDLIAAYQRYRKMVEDPWELWCAGSGPLEYLLQGESGVRSLGFVQPNQYPQILKEAGVFVLPSRHEPWGVAIHEATAAGLPVICTRQCGSSVELVQDGYNGFVFDAGDVEALVDLMCYMTSGAVDLSIFGRRSTQLSERLSPAQWADYLVHHVERNLALRR